MHQRGKDVAYRVANADEIVNINNGGCLRRRHGHGLRWCCDDRLWGLSGLALGLARHGLSLCGEGCRLERVWLRVDAKRQKVAGIAQQ